MRHAPDHWMPQRGPERLLTWWRARAALTREVTIVLVVKVLVLALIWLAFFRAPAPSATNPPPATLAHHLLAPLPASETRDAAR